MRIRPSDRRARQGELASVTRRPARAIVLSLFLLALPVGPASANDPRPDRSVPPAAPVTDVTAALAADGTFIGAAGVHGAVDLVGWTLSSDLSRGEPPRFEPADRAAATAAATPTTRGWSPLGANGAGTDGALGGDVMAIAVSGSNVYVGGTFTNVAGIPQADYVARWNGSAWSALGSNASGTDGAIVTTASQAPFVYALAVFGSSVYVGGNFTDVAGIPQADHIARWTGTAWAAVGTGPGGVGAIQATVWALAVGPGGDVYAGGGFTNAAGIAQADRVARWNGSTWSALGSDAGGAGGTDGAIDTLVMAVTVAGSDVYVGGLFTNAAGIPQADYLAAWTGSAWQPLGSDPSFTNGALDSFVWDIAVAGSDIYVGGAFTNAGGVARADNVARWTRTIDPFANGWAALGADPSGTNGALNNTVGALALVGTDLYVAGDFDDAAGIAQADNVARWNGTRWSAVGANGAGTDGALVDYAGTLAAGGGVVYAGGGFSDAAGIATADRIAAFRQRQPDARIQRVSAAFVGEGIYNTTGTGQARSATVPAGSSASFGVSIQNDGAVSDRFRVGATGARVAGYPVRYYRGSTEITEAVVGGTYETPSLAPGASHLITARVKVAPTASAGSSISRLVTSTSVAETARRDTVRFTVKRS